jgi:dihydroxyacetone kinase
MLTAAVCGELFASPSVDAVYAAILAVTGDAGALLIVKNYTGDRINFGLAMERARARGLKVEMVIVADDVALDTPQPRGIAGTVLVHKVAGYFADAGRPLAKVAQLAKLAAQHTHSLGVSFSTCTLPGQPPKAQIGAEEMEIGLGRGAAMPAMAASRLTSLLASCVQASTASQAPRSLRWPLRAPSSRRSSRAC